GVEVECGVLGNEKPIASLPGEIVSHGFQGADWYDFSAKYEEGGMDLIVPPRLPQETIERVQELAVRSFVAGECEGMARVDFFVRDEREVLLNELNTIPGFTATSVYAKLFEDSGIPYAELVDRLVQLLVLPREPERTQDKRLEVGARLEQGLRLGFEPFAVAYGREAVEQCGLRSEIERLGGMPSGDQALHLL